MDNSTIVITPDAIPPFYGTCFVLFTTALFVLINGLLPTGNEWKWDNVLVSWIHAVIISIWATLSVFIYPELINDLIHHYNYFTFIMICFSTGYFLYDLLDIVVNNKFKLYWEVVLHHIIVGGMFYYNIYNSTCIAFTVVALATEINTVFLHTRKLLQMSGSPYDSSIYRTNNAVNLVTFVLFRFGALAVIGYAVVFWRLLVSPMYYAMLTASWMVMTVINVVLFWRLVKNDLLRPVKSDL